MLRFMDGTQAAIIGLTEIMADLYDKGREVSAATAEEIIKGLEETNYIPPSARREYRHLILDAYREYVAARKINAPR